MCEGSGRQLGGQTDAAEGRVMDGRRDERCDESRETLPDHHTGVCPYVFVCVRVCAQMHPLVFLHPRHLSDSPEEEEE